jgi:hypothetical protein
VAAVFLAQETDAPPASITGLHHDFRLVDKLHIASAAQASV